MTNVSSELRRLGALIGSLLGGPPIEPMAVADDVIRLAIDRHQVGPITWAAIRHGGFKVSAGASSGLTRAYDKSVENRVAVLARLERVRAIFAKQGIDWSTFKGTVQAERLYSDPAWRVSSDIDLLVGPKSLVSAIDALCTNDFICSNPPIPPLRALRIPLFATIRDAKLIARDDHSCALEVHIRPFFSGRCPTFPIVSSPFPAPAIGPELVTYLIAHGAGSFWVRLKWLVDLVPALAKLSATEMVQVGTYSEQFGTALSTAASLLLLRVLFPFVRMDSLLPWLAQYEDRAGVKRRLKIYLASLELQSDWKHSPLDNRWTALHANLLLWEHSTSRMHMFAAGALSSVARRLAAAANRPDRGLTISEVPPAPSFGRVV